MTSVFDLIQLVATNLWFYGGIFILVLSLLVFVHEWGHYIVARMCGVKVETFSIGFGKEIFGWDDKKGTRWKVSMIPLGGYVKMFGDTDPASSGHTEGMKDGEKIRPFTKAEREVAFFTKSVWKRSLIVFAGPAINFLFAILLLFGLYSVHGQPVTAPMASAVIAGSAADKAGFKPHDEILSIDGETINRFEDIRRVVMVALDTPLEFTVLRNEKEIVLKAIPTKQEITDRFGFTHSRGQLGIIGPGDGIAIKNITEVAGRKVSTPDQIRKGLTRNMDRRTVIRIGDKEEEGSQKYIIYASFELNEGLKSADKESMEANALVLANRTGEFLLTPGVANGLKASVTETWRITTSTLKALGQMFTGTRSATELGGIIRIGAIAGDMAQAGFLALITFTALLSINLGLINLFPIPMLDGGHLVFYAIEALKGKPVSERTQEYAFRFGFMVLIGMMLFANLNDLFQMFIKG